MRFKTCRRYNDPGHAHSLTFSCFQRRQFLSKDHSCNWLVKALADARRKWQFDLWAWVIMPEHVHLLVWPRRAIYSIGKMLASIKLPVARRAVRHVRCTAPHALWMLEDVQPNGEKCHRFWQRGGGYDRNIYDEAAVFAEIDYIHQNPVRRGLVERAEDWPWSSAAFYAGKRDVIIRPDIESLPIRREA